MIELSNPSDTARFADALLSAETLNFLNSLIPLDHKERIFVAADQQAKDYALFTAYIRHSEDVTYPLASVLHYVQKNTIINEVPLCSYDDVKDAIEVFHKRFINRTYPGVGVSFNAAIFQLERFFNDLTEFGIDARCLVEIDGHESAAERNQFNVTLCLRKDFSSHDNIQFYAGTSVKIVLNAPDFSEKYLSGII